MNLQWLLEHLGTDTVAFMEMVFYCKGKKTQRRNSFSIHLFSSSCRKHFLQILKVFLVVFFYIIYFQFLQSSKSKTSIPTFLAQSLIYCCLSPEISFRVSIKTCWALTIPTINLISFRQTCGTKKQPYLNVNTKKGWLFTFPSSFCFLGDPEQTLGREKSNKAAHMSLCT